MAQQVVLENNLEYLSLSKPKRVLFKLKKFFTGIPKKIGNFFTSIPQKTRDSRSKFLQIFKNVAHAMTDGDYKTRLSFLFMGAGLVTRRQVFRGVLYFLYEVAFIVFFALVGFSSLRGLPTLGQMAEVSYIQKGGGDTVTSIMHDDSFNILLYSLITIALILVLIFLWYNQLVDSLRLQREAYIGRYASDKQTIRNVLDKSYDKTLLFIPMLGLALFTILPIIMMIVVGFTNYNAQHSTPTKLFDWVGMQNFALIFAAGGDGDSKLVLQVFLEVLLWTLVWAFFATFSNYFLGMIVAMIINIKGIKLKKVWRTVLITTIAVPQFISLLLVSRMFSDNGIINGIAGNIYNAITGNTYTNISFLGDRWLNKVMIIVLNTWVGIPYTMLICTGLLMNIPEDLYESARIDGASPAKMYFKITLPYMLFVTGPYLISQFVGNINNFNVIYFLSGGGPAFTFGTGTVVPSIISVTGVGRSDLLITWLYKMSVDSTAKEYGFASVLGLMIFAVVAFFSLIFYGHSNSIQNEEEFQ